MKKIALILVLFLSACRTLILYHPHKKLHYFPNQIGLDYENVYFKTSDNVWINAWYVKSKKNRGTVIFQHGNAGNISNRLNQIRIVNKMGFNILVYDYRGFGKSLGSPSMEGIKKDSLAAWDYITIKKGEDYKRIIIWGRSLGGSVAAFLASKRSCKVLIIESTFVSFKEIVRDYCFFCPALLFVSDDEYNTLSYLKNNNTPTLIIHSKEDKIIPFKHSVELSKKMGGKNKLIIIKGGHNYGFMLSASNYPQSIEKFLQEYYE